MRTCKREVRALATVIGLLAAAVLFTGPLTGKDRPRQPALNIDPPAISTDRTVKYDYDIVYVRLPRKGYRNDRANKFESPIWAQAGVPLQMHPGADLMLLRPDGREEVLVPAGKGSVTDPFVSYDGEWVYYSHFHDLTNYRHGFVPSSADVYKVHVKSKKIVRLTDGGFSPNTGAAVWADDYRKPQAGRTTMPHPVCNVGPCPLPGGKVIFTSNRNGFVSPRSTNNGHNNTLQLFVMDDDGGNVEMIGHLNLGSALHPVVLRDGRVMFSTLENQGRRDDLSWGLWSIHPDGTNWNPIISSFLTTAFHFQTQLSDGAVVAGAYYGGVGTNGFGTYVKVPVERKSDDPAFGPGLKEDPLNGPSYARDERRPVTSRLTKVPFSPRGLEQLTLWVNDGDATAQQQMRDGPWIGKVTHPSAAPDNHLLTVWNAHPLGDHDVDAGIYLIKSGKPIHEPGQMLRIKHDPKYDAQWPRALVPYRRIYGVSEPRALKPLANDGKQSRHLPEGTPFGLVGSSSLYKRESFPDGKVARGSVTATWPRDRQPIPYDMGWQNWRSQGADAGLYTNEDIHAVRILVMDPTTDRRNGPRAGRLFRSHAMERLRILGEIPVRKVGEDGKQPLDPDGNPDTSFLAKIPADVAWTFQTLDKDGMVLNMAQTWHQVRPGEVRTDCGGCHAHSQKPTPFEKTAAASKDHPLFDLTKRTPLLTSKALDESKKKWDAGGETGLRFDKGVKNVEYHRDVRPILERSCVACHTQRWKKAAGNLVLDDDRPETHADSHFPQAKLPNHYFRLAADHKGKFGHKPLRGGYQGSRYVWPMQARRSLLVWKVFGRRTDGFSNDDFPTETVPGDPTSLRLKDRPLANTERNRNRAVVGYTGGVMPPPEAVAGTYLGPDGDKVKVAPLSDEDRRTLVRWIDLGCPIDLDHDPRHPEQRGYGWMLDDNRPTLTLTHPRTGSNDALSRIVVGMHDYDSGLDLNSFRVVADFAVDGNKPGTDLASLMKDIGQGVWELRLKKSITELKKGKLTVSVKDRQGNITRIERTFSVGAGERLSLENVPAPAALVADEPLAQVFSLQRAARSLDAAALHWQKTRRCAACHTLVPYLMARPALAAVSPEPPEVRRFFETVVEKRLEAEPALPRDGVSAVIVELAVALAFHDRATSGKLHPLTRQALDRMWTRQRPDGGWQWPFRDTPPIKSDEHHGVTLSALATGVAPEKDVDSAAARKGLAGIRKFLKAQPPTSLHQKAMLLWASLHVAGLMTPEEQAKSVKALAAAQRPDGGWSLASLVDNRDDPGRQTEAARKARAEKGHGSEFLIFVGDSKVYKSSLASDGYATGFAVYVLRQAGVPADDARIRHGIAWLKGQQRESGRWFTPSQSWHTRNLIANAGSAYAVLALHACGEIPAPRREK